MWTTRGGEGEEREGGKGVEEVSVFRKRRRKGERKSHSSRRGRVFIPKRRERKKGRRRKKRRGTGRREGEEEAVGRGRGLPPEREKPESGPWLWSAQRQRTGQRNAA